MTTLSTLGNQIVDEQGNYVRLKSINWFGAEGTNNLPHGLWQVSYKALIDQIAAWGFNCIRIAFSGDTFASGSAISGLNTSIADNTVFAPGGVNVTPLAAMDIIIAYAATKGLYVVLDHHRRTAGAGADGSPTDSSYTESDWHATWVALATHYASQPNVIGADLHNEPHDLTWDTWAALAEGCAAAIHAVAPGWLIFVEGVGGSGYWWGGNLSGVATRPVVLGEPNKLVYSPHEYGQSVGTQSWLAYDGGTAPDNWPNNLRAVFRGAWGYIAEQGIAPVWIGEFGGKFGRNGSGASDPSGSPHGTYEAQWLAQLSAYCNGDFDGDGSSDLTGGRLGISFAYWALNPVSADTGGLLCDDWVTPQAYKIELLQTLLTAPSYYEVPAYTPPSETYYDRFVSMYQRVKATSSGYFGPTSGSKARTIPYHSLEELMIEAPDYGHESVSETVSFWVGLEAWYGALTGDWSGYGSAWASIEANYIPSSANQPIGTYSPSSPADYTPEGNYPSDYPRLGDSTAAKGVDGLAAELESTYGVKTIYLMHWIIDVDGRYGYLNGDGGTQGVYINNYQRGMNESVFETVTFPCWEDFANGGGTYGYLPLFNQNKPLYPAAEFDYAKQWRYTCAPDAEARVIQNAWWANKFAAAQGVSLTTYDGKAKRMGDYLRYSLMDKYFRQIGDNRAEGSTSAAPYTACHYLVSWYVSWGGEIPASGTGTWSFRIGSSDAHQGYQAPDIAYFMATGGGGYAPQSASAGDIWLGSLYRQIEMLRWLQSPEGPIAGGVTNSWHGRYETPTDGRQAAQFYGMYYTYAPVWHDPPSNNWCGFQFWGLQRSSDLFLEVADKSTTLATTIRNNLEIILNRFVAWVLQEVNLYADGTFDIPSSLSWVSDTQVVGETTTASNMEGVYEYLPSLDWDGTGDYAAFWAESTVPNPNLHCRITGRGDDLGAAACLAHLLIDYAKAKQLLGKYDEAIPNSSYTAADAYTVAKALLDRTWTNYLGAKGIAAVERKADYARLGDAVYIPASYSGSMPNGDAIAPGSTFLSMRSWIEGFEGYDQVAAYLADPDTAPVPTFTYHRFWAQAEYAMALAAAHRYFEQSSGPAVSVSPSSASFGAVLAGSQGTATVTLTNTGGEALNYAAVVSAGSFSITSGASGNIQPGASASIVLAFSPSAEMVYSGTLTITSNASTSPNVVALTGVGYTGSSGSSGEIGRVTRNYVSAHQRDRVHQGSIYASERRALVTNFNGAIPKGRAIVSAVWQTRDTLICAMSDPVVRTREVQVSIAAQYSGEARIRVDATLDDGSIYSAWHVISVRAAPMFGGSGWIAGPSRLEARLG